MTEEAKGAPKLMRRANVVMVLLGLKIVSCLATVVVLIRLHSALADAASAIPTPAGGDLWDPAHRENVAAVARAYSPYLRVVGGADVLLFLGCTIGWLVWLTAAMKLARERFVSSSLPSSLWVAACYFIPILALYKPRAHLLILAHVSDPSSLPEVVERRESPPGYRNNPHGEATGRPWQSVSAPITAWWLSLYMWALIVFVSAIATLHAGSPQLSRENVGWRVAVEAGQILCVGLAIAVVRGIALRQRERLRRMEALPTTEDDEKDVIPRRRRRARARPEGTVTE